MSLAPRGSSAGTDASLLEVVDTLYRSVLNPQERDRIPRLVGGLVGADLTSKPWNCEVWPATACSETADSPWWRARGMPRVLDHTSRAETALRSGAYGLRLSRGRLTADDYESEARLRSALDYAGRGHVPLFGIGLRGRDRSIVWCTVLPLTRAEQSVAGEPHDCLVLLHVPGDRDLIRAERVARSLQISPAEGDVLAGLMRGEGPVAIAARTATTTDPRIAA